MAAFVLRLHPVRNGGIAEGPGVSHDAVARRAEVGIGTLYRHFPTGVALLQAVYRHEVDALIQRGADLQTSVNRAGALRDDVTSADHAGALLCPPA